MDPSLVRFTDIGSPEAIPEGRSFRILFDANLNMLRIVCRDPKALECMREAFSQDNDTAFFVSMHGYRAPERVYLINAFGYFKPGMLFEVLSYIKSHYGTLSTTFLSEQCRAYVTEMLTPLMRYLQRYGEEGFEIPNIAEDSGRNARNPSSRLEMRGYQREAIRKLIFEGYGRGLIELPTSAGKSFVIANLIHAIDKCVLKGLRYLIFVPNAQLVTQFLGDLEDYGFRPSDVTALVANGKGRMKYDPDARIVISNRQYLFKNRDRLPKVDVLINDEVHQSKAKSATLELVDSMPCPMKIGLSATLPRDTYERLSLVGSFGRVLFVEEITHLQSEGYISELEINLIKVVDRKVAADRGLPFNEHPTRRFSAADADGLKFNEAYDQEVAYVNENYAKLYAPIIERLVTLEGNTLVLFDRLEFGRNMHSLAKGVAQGKGVHYVDGQTPVKDREAMRSALEASGDNIVFGQCSILSTGINIKNLTNLVMMVSTKSFSRVLQSVGRTLRLHRDKDRARLFDISFNFKYSQKHLAERLQIYRKMYGKGPDTRVTFEV